MLKFLAAVAFASTVTAAHADEWHGTDKTKHFVAGILASSLATAGTKNEFQGLMVGVALGAGKELLDVAGYGDASIKDLAWTVAGAYLGTKFAGFFLAPEKKGIVVGFQKTF